MASSTHHDLMASQEVDAIARAEGVNWIIDTHSSMDLDPGTLFQAVAHMDHYLQTHVVDERKMQFLPATALYVAVSHIMKIKCSEWRFWFYAFNAPNLAIMEPAVKQMESEMLADVACVLPLHVPEQTLRSECRDVEATREEELTARYILELCLVDYAMTRVSPSSKASAAVYCALQLSGRAEYCPTRQTAYYSRSRIEYLRPLLERMATLLLEAPRVTNFAPYKKHKSEGYHGVACLSETKISKMRQMANGTLTFERQ